MKRRQLAALTDEIRAATARLDAPEVQAAMRTPAGQAAARDLLADVDRLIAQRQARMKRGTP